MSLRSLRIQARYNILTPIVLMGASIAAPAFAVTTNVVVPVDGSLTNSQTIYGSGQPAVSSTGNVDFITNLANGKILGGTYTGIYVNGNINSLTNNGTIDSTSALGVNVVGNTGSFNNTGIINSYNTGVYLQGDVGTFTNSGRVTSYSYGVYIDGAADSFTNSGRIEAYYTAVYLGDDVESFSNSGLISAQSYYGVEVSGDVGTFTNSGQILSYTTAVYIDGSVGTFTNSGIIKSADYSGVYISDNVDSFTNSGLIQSYSTGVYIGGVTGSFSNSGTIRSAFYYGAYFDDDVESFNNEGTITAGSSTAVYVNGDLGSFTNSGRIESLYTGGYGVYVDGVATSFANSGDIGSDNTAVYFNSDVGSFTNSGNITSQSGYGVYVSGDSTSSFENSGDISSYYQGVYFSGDVESFVNSGSIYSMDYTGVYVSGDVGSFTNSGSILSYSYGAYLSGDVGSFSNSGLISTLFYDGVYISGDVTSFDNSGEIYSGSSTGVEIGGNTGTFTNSGLIHSLQSDGVYFSGTVDSFANSGTITGSVGSGYYGVYFGDDVTTAANSGRISGYTGVYFSGAGGTTFTNAGLIEGYGGTAVQFGSGDDTLALENGASFYGIVDFGGGTDTLDLANYNGNIILDYDDTLTTIVPGGNTTVDTGSQVYVVDQSALQQSGIATAGIVTGMADLLAAQLFAEAGGGGADAPLGYAEEGTTTASAGATVWLSGLGGGMILPNADEVMTGYGAVMAGIQGDMGGFTIGGTGGYALGRTVLGGGSQTVDTQLGAVGVYGSADADIVDLTFSVLGGIGANHSERVIQTVNGPEVAVGDYSSWFIAPSAGVSVAVLEDGTNELRLGGSVGMVYGANAGYTETGNAGVLAVDPQTFGLLTAKAELSDTMVISSTDAGDIKGTVSVAGFVQSNLGTSDTTFDVYDFSGGTVVGTGIAAAPTGIVYGAQVGVGIDVPVMSGVSVTGGMSASVRSDGAYGGNVRAGLSGSF